MSLYMRVRPNKCRRSSYLLPSLGLHSVLKFVLIPPAWQHVFVVISDSTAQYIELVNAQQCASSAHRGTMLTVKL